MPNIMSEGRFTDEFLEHAGPVDTWQKISLNPNISFAELKRLSTHANLLVRRAVIDNKNVTPEILENLFNENYEDSSFIIRLLSAPATPESIFIETAAHPNVSVRRETSALLRTPPEALVSLTKDEDEMTASDAVNTLWYKHKPYNTWPEEWVYAHFAVTKHIPDDTW